MYNLPIELKLPFNESKHLYSEFKCKIPIKIIKNWYQNHVFLQLNSKIKINLSMSNFNFIRIIGMMSGLICNLKMKNNI